MIADHFRYIAESAEGDFLTQARNNALYYYKEADTAGKELLVLNPIKLGVALNFSVFYYEVMQDSK